MRKIGILFGMENTFPGALVDRINSMSAPGIEAEFIKLGAVTMAAPSGYRIDHRPHLSRYSLLSSLFKKCSTRRHSSH